MDSPSGKFFTLLSGLVLYLNYTFLKSALLRLAGLAIP